MRISVLSCYWADITVDESSGAISYGSGRRLCGATSVGVTHNKVASNVFESGASIYNKSFVSGGTIDLSTHSLTEVDRAAILHSITVTDSNIDYEIGGDNDTPRRGAFGFAVQEEDVNAGTPMYRCKWYYDTTMSPADTTYNTSDNNGPNTEPENIQLNFSRRPTDRKYCRTAVVKTIEQMEAFFKTVQKSAS